MLDFGCGTGNNCIAFKSGDYIGVDVASERIEYAKSVHPDYSFDSIENGSLEKFEDKSIDVIFIAAVLHHISDSDIIMYMSEFIRILVDGGQVIIFEPHIDKDFPIQNLWMKTFDDGKYIRTDKEYMSLFEKDFNMKKVHTFRTFNMYSAVILTGRLS